MKGIGCWIVDCIPSEYFELTQFFFLNKWGELIWIFEIVDFLLISILIGERSEPKNFVENEHFMRQFPW